MSIMVDCTDDILSQLTYAYRPAHLRDIKPTKSVTPARKALLVRLHGLKLAAVSNCLIYDNAIRALNRTEQKMVLALALGGHLRVFRVQGPLPGVHEKSKIGAHDVYHYELRSPAHEPAEREDTSTT